MTAAIAQMTADALWPNGTIDFEPSGLLTTVRSLLPGRRRALDLDATLSNARRKFCFVSPSGDKLIVTFNRDFQAPTWFLNVMDKFARIISLESDWDSYGAQPIELDSVCAALELLLAIMPSNTPAPEVVPTPRGSIQLEWHIQGIDLEIDALSRGVYRMAFENFNTNETIEDLITSNLNDFRRPLGLLTTNNNRS